MPREFAPGIPAGRVIKSIPRVSAKADNQEWDVSLSLHPAQRRGDHYDLRLVDPKGKGHSWALPRLPEPGQSTYAAQQPTHSKSYSLRKEPWTIPPGYGATQPGRKVEPVFVQKAEVVEAGQEKVRFLRHHGQETDEFVLRKVYRDGMTPLWALNNATKNRKTREGQKLPSSKPKYKEVKPEQVDFSDAGEVMTPKFDGAHVLVDMKGPKAPMRVYSYRPTERKTGVIEHTYKFPEYHKRRTTNNLRNTMIRAELWASKDGKAIPAEQLGGLLNAGVLNSRRKQEEMGVQLRLTGIDVVKHHGKKYENKTYEDKLNVLRDVTRGTKGLVELPPVARTEEEKRRLMAEVESGKLPDTKEGVVLHRSDSPAPPTKVKFKPQDDVYVREVFSKSRGKAKGHAGGFAYSITPDGPIVGRVGTGFDHKTRKDMLDNPENYVGRVAKVRSQGPFRSGALRAPSFDEWHIDKTPPELMKEAIGKRQLNRILEASEGEHFLRLLGRNRQPSRAEALAAKMDVLDTIYPKLTSSYHGRKSGLNRDIQEVKELLDPRHIYDYGEEKVVIDPIAHNKEVRKYLVEQSKKLPKAERRGYLKKNVNYLLPVARTANYDTRKLTKFPPITDIRSDTPPNKAGVLKDVVWRGTDPKSLHKMKPLGDTPRKKQPIWGSQIPGVGAQFAGDAPTATLKAYDVSRMGPGHLSPPSQHIGMDTRGMSAERVAKLPGIDRTSAGANPLFETVMTRGKLPNQPIGEYRVVSPQQGIWQRTRGKGPQTKTSHVLLKQGEDRILDRLREYKKSVVDKDRVLDTSYLASKSTRAVGLGRVGLRAAKEYLDDTGATKKLHEARNRAVGAVRSTWRD